MSAGELVVDLEVSTAPGRLVVRYRVTNRGAGAVWLLDDMLVHGQKGLKRSPRELIVTEADDERTVRLIRGVALPEENVMTILLPGARLLGPGATLEAEAETPLPLRARHPQDDSRRLRGERDHIVLEVGVLAEEQPPLYHTALEDGSDALRPSQEHAFANQIFVSSAPLKLAGT